MEGKRLILNGIAASKGVYEGRARVLSASADIDKLQEGDILVTPYTTSDWVEAYLVVRAVVTDQGGISSHQAIVSRQCGIPCVVGTQYATKYIQDEERIIVDGGKGEVTYKLD